MNDPKGKIEEIRNSPLNMNGTEQHITSLYYPQSNGLSKRQGLLSKGSWWKRLRLTIHCLRNFICEFRIFPSTSNLNWSVLKKRAMVNLSSKKYLMVFFQMLSPHNKCLKTLMKTIFVHKKKNSVIIIDVIKCLTTSKWFKKYF